MPNPKDESKGPPPARKEHRSVFQALGGRGVAPSRIMLREDVGSSEAPIVNTRSVQIPKGPDGRYQVLGELARGGVGIVLKGRDVDIGRDVAMKVLRDEHANNDDVIQRFVEEAQIGGQLQHPGVIPVYEMGLQPDNRPYFTMQLVKGRTLAALLAERTDPRQDRRRFVAIFESVCQTLSYAHSRGVIHRDLKPSNIMVGRFGQVLVVDWGLAKVRGRAGADEARPDGSPADPEQTLIATVRSGVAAAESMVGSILGTPAYMPPEQARGDVKSLDERSDVFGLGAILCEILTGLPPYAGSDQELVVQAARGDLTGARERLAVSGADPDLIALTESCLAAARAARPADAGALARHLTDHLASVDERRRRAEDAEATETVRAAAEVRGRKLTGWLGASVALMLLVGGAGYAWVSADSAASARRAEERVEEALRSTELLRTRAQSDATVQTWSRTVSAAKNALALAESPEVGADQLREAQALLSRVEELAGHSREEAAIHDRSATLSAQLDEIAIRTIAGGTGRPDALYAAALAHVGIDVEVLTPENAVRAYRARPLAAALSDALDAWARELRARGEPDDRLRSIADAVDTRSFRTWIREARTLERLRLFDSAADQQTFDAGQLVALAQAFDELGGRRRAGQLLAEARRRFPGDVFAALHLGAFLRDAALVPNLEVPDDSPLRRRAAEVAAFYRADFRVRPDDFSSRFFDGSMSVEKVEARHRDTHAECGEATGFEFVSSEDAHTGRFEVLFENGVVEEHWVRVDAEPPHRIGAIIWSTLHQAPSGFSAGRRTFPNYVAVRHLTAALALRPGSVDVRGLLAEALLDDASGEQAAEVLAGAGAKVDRNAQALRARARLSLLAGDVDAAVADARAAVALAPESAAARCRLGWILRERGQFQGALDEYRAASAASAAKSSWRARSEAGVAECERLVAATGRLPAILAGEAQPTSADDALTLARAAARTGRAAEAVGLYRTAFRENDKLEPNLLLGFRYEALRTAAFAASAAAPSKAAPLRSRMRKWLRRELDGWRTWSAGTRGATKLADSPRKRAQMRHRLRRLLRDPAFSFSRDPEQVATLPETEQDRFAGLWAEVETQLGRVGR